MTAHFPDKQNNQNRHGRVAGIVKPCSLARDLHALDYPVFHKGRIGPVDKHRIMLQPVPVHHHRVTHIDDRIQGYHAVVAVVECGIVLQPCGKDRIMYHYDAVALG